jgi:7,8-dihydropterin-6-yl-methyl-4-(beta-D-ribofuranosyl)aminobenzene 5'-phosphate synthase
VIVTALVENYADKRLPGLKTELGLAIHIDCQRTQILFDAGGTDALIHNARLLGIDLSLVNAVVVSHGHYDHADGLASFFPLNAGADVYMHSRARDKYYAGPFSAISKRIGINQGLFQKYSDRFIEVDSLTEIAEETFILTDMPRSKHIPPSQQFFFTEENGSVVPDLFKHEIALVIRENDGLVVFAGGCHCGILNLIEAVHTQFPGSIIKAVFGGFQTIEIAPFGMLLGGNVDLQWLAAELNGIPDLMKIYACHSLNRPAYNRLKKLLGDKLDYFAAGCRVVI